jgi:hypothetical protein
VVKVGWRNHKAMDSEGLVDKTGLFSGLAAEDRRHCGEHLMPRLYRRKAKIETCRVVWKCVRCGVYGPATEEPQETPSTTRPVTLRPSIRETNWLIPQQTPYSVGRDSSVGIATRYGMDGPGIGSRCGARFFSTRPDRPWGPPSLLYNGYRVILGVKRSWRGVDHPRPSRAEVKERVKRNNSPPPLLGLQGLL